MIPGKPKDPHAIRAALGKRLTGASIPKEGTETDDSAASADCHRTTTTVVGLKETSAYSFVQQVHHKEFMNSFAVKKMFELNFSAKDTKNRCHKKIEDSYKG